MAISTSNPHFVMSVATGGAGGGCAGSAGGGNVTTSNLIFSPGYGKAILGAATGSYTIPSPDLHILERLATIEHRLSILVPDPEKLSKYAQLKQAYDHYKLMEALYLE